MKKLAYLFALVIVFAACNNNSDTNTSTPGDTLKPKPDTLYRPDTPGIDKN